MMSTTTLQSLLVAVWVVLPHAASSKQQASGGSNLFQKRSVDVGDVGKLH